MNGKEKWVEEVMQSANAIGMARTSASFTPGVMQRIQSGGRQVQMVAPSAIWRMAAVILVMIVLNFSTYIIIGKSSTAEETTSEATLESFANDYSLTVQTGY